MTDTTANTIPSTPSETDPSVPYYCRYLTTKGEQCRQIALNGRNFCFAHRDPEPDFGCRSVKVPLLEDSASIQLMLTKILHGLLNDHFPGTVASKAIYCCQVAASTIARPVAYRPKLGEKLPAKPMAVMEIYRDKQGNLMGPLEEYPLPAAPAEPESARAKARAEWDPCVAHHFWCPGPAAPYKCADCQRVAQLSQEPPREEPAAIAPAPEPSAVFPTPDPGATPPADEPSSEECGSDEYSTVSSSHECELVELTAAAGSDPCPPASCLLPPVSCSGPEPGARFPVPCSHVVDLIKPPTNMIPNDKKPAPQGGTPHSQNKSTQIGQSLAGGGEFGDGSLRGLGASFVRHLEDGADDQFRIVEMDPVTAALGEHLATARAVFAEVPNGRGIAGSDDDDRSLADRLGRVHVGDGGVDGVEMGEEAAIKARRGPVSSDGGTDLGRHLADFGIEAARQVFAFGAGTADEESGEFRGADEVGPDSKARNADAGAVQTDAGEPLRAGDGGETIGVDGRPFVGAHGIEQEDACGLGGVIEREALHDEAAKRVADEDPRRLDSRGEQRAAKLGSHLRWSAIGDGRAAPAQSTAIVSHGMEMFSDGVLDVEPVETGGGESGFKDDGGSLLGWTLFDDVEPSAIADVDETAGGLQTLAIDEAADPLIEEAGENQQRDEGNDGRWDGDQG